MSLEPLVHGQYIVFGRDWILSFWKADFSHLIYLFVVTRQERDDILSSLLRRSRMVHQHLNELEGVTCNEADGALYAFPRIRLTNKAQKVAESKGLPADEYYCLKVMLLLMLFLMLVFPLQISTPYQTVRECAMVTLP